MSDRLLPELDEDWRSGERPSLTSETEILPPESAQAEMTSVTDWGLIKKKDKLRRTLSRSSSKRPKLPSGMSAGIQSRLGSLRRGAATVRRR